ncbi:hypothetical protein HY469_04795 [Candidatus Roizmanbacteria bacterium]|nr:hypothetical protein [Candidatus Roizmanbacteria bacterium]
MLIEEVEAYDCHRHSVSGGNGSNNITIRRSYANPRGYTRCKVSPEYYCGEFPISFYDSANRMENVISEETLHGIDVLESADNSKVFGSIAMYTGYGTNIGTARGLIVQSRNTTGEFMSNPFFKDVVIFSSEQIGAEVTSVENARLENITVINSGNVGIYTGLGSYPIPTTDPRPSTFATNILSVFNRLEGIKVGPDGIPNWSFDYVNAYGNGDNFDPDDFSCPNCFSNATQIDPKMYNPATGQGCIVYVPQGSPMKGAGKNGADIGANVLYAYENGTLNASKKLWNTSVDNGRFIGCGAIIPGVNDIAGKSCFDVHKRLNVNTNGCQLPY